MQSSTLNIEAKMEMSGQYHAPAAVHRERTLVYIEQEAAWAPEAV
jgi:hypothetical protein